MTKEHAVLRRKSPGNKTWDVSPTYTNATCLGTLLFTAQVAESAKLLRGQLPSPRTLVRCPESPVPSSTPQSSPSTGSLPAHRLKESAFPGAQLVKNLPPTMQETRVQSLGQEDPLEKGIATHSAILAWSGLLFPPPPGDLPDPGIEPASPTLAGGLFTVGTPGKPILYWGIASE